MAKGKKEHRPTMTFQESAKKFKPGPVAPPDDHDDGPDMSGATQPSDPRPDHERSVAAMHEPVQVAGGVQEDAAMTDGSPGKLTKMPGERARRQS